MGRHGSGMATAAIVLVLVCLSVFVVGPAAALAASKAAAATPAQDRWYGVYMYGVPASLAPLAVLQSELGRNAKVIEYFDDEEPDTDFNATWNSAVAANSSTPMVTMQLWNDQLGTNQPAYSLNSICGGVDAYLQRWAAAAKTYGGPVWLRPEPEMNGDWSPWCGTVNGNTPAQFVTAWRHIYGIFSAAGASNVKFVWCPNATSVPDTKANAISASRGRLRRLHRPRWLQLGTDVHYEMDIVQRCVRCRLRGGHVAFLHQADHPR